MRLEPFARPDWSPLPFEGSDAVAGQVHVREPGFFVSLLRCAPDGTIHEHPGERDAYVVCLEGEGWTSVGEERSPLRAGEFVVWPQGVPHRLWTEGTTMTTLMYEAW